MTKTNQIHERELASIQIPPAATIMEAMKVIDQGAVQIALVVDETEKLIGVLTDGDLRRALIAGAKLDAEVGSYVSKSFRAVTETTGRSGALDLMQSLSIEQLPILDDQGRLCGLHLLNELVRANPLPNAALILAGGKGTRLGKLTQSTPKPMIKVAGRPILERIVLHLVGGGVRKIFLSVNYLAEVIQDHFGDGSQFGCSIEYLHETEPLGTGGPLALLEKHNIKDAVMVMNGDLVVEFDVEAMFKTHKSHQNSITIGTKTYNHQVPFGCIQTDGKQVVSIVEKPTLHETINAGIYVLAPSVVASVPLEFQPITQIVDAAVSNKEKVECFEIDEWIDVGRPAQLSEARGQ